MNRVIVTSHAVSRYRQRVAPLTYDEVIARLDTPRIRRMIDFGAREIILPTGHHAVVCDGVIVTVRPKPVPPKLRANRNTGGVVE